MLLSQQPPTDWYWPHTRFDCRWNSTASIDGYAFTCRDLWPFDLISMSHGQVLTFTSPNLGEIGCNIYKDIVFTRYFGLLPAVTLTFWPQNLISTSTNPDTFVIKIGFEIDVWCSNGFQDAQTDSCTDRQTDRQTDPNTIQHCSNGECRETTQIRASQSSVHRMRDTTMCHPCWCTYGWKCRQQ